LLYFHFFIVTHPLAQFNLAMGRPQPDSHKKEKNAESPPCFGEPYCHTKGSSTAASYTGIASRNENSGNFVQTAFNSPPSSNYLPESPAHLPGVSTTTAINSPVAVDAAALAAAHGVPQPPARLKRPNVSSQLSRDSETGSKRIKRSQLCLDSESLFSFLRAPIVATLKSQRNGSSPRSASVPNTVSAFAKNNFVSTKYKLNPQNTFKPATRSNNRVIHLPLLRDPNETCALLLARNDLPLDFAPESIKPTFSLDSKTLRRYIVEDYLFAAACERVILLVATSHPSFDSHWFCIYERQEKGRKPLIFGDVLFFQIEAAVLKNAYRANFISGHYTQKEFGNLFLSRDGAALGLIFPGCPTSFEFKLNAADVFFSSLGHNQNRSLVQEATVQVEIRGIS
jgi:hypothetical protein